MEGDAGQTLAWRDPVALLNASSIFRDLDTETLRTIGSALDWLSLPGGATLFEAGEPSGLYL